MALLRAANGLVQEDAANAGADANADITATTTPVSTATVPTITAHVAGKSRCRVAGRSYHQEQSPDRSN
ncbi:MAG TPA: hypothetical protein VKD00_06605 [Methyloceanibacter sp.]|nr:hypothetical protein [Methyloceanibacter sp.]